MNVGVSVGTRRGHQCLNTPGAGITDSCELPSVGAGNLSPLQEQQYMLVTISPVLRNTSVNVYLLNSDSLIEPLLKILSSECAYYQMLHIVKIKNFHLARHGGENL